MRSRPRAWTIASMFGSTRRARILASVAAVAAGAVALTFAAGVPAPAAATGSWTHQVGTAQDDFFEVAAATKDGAYVAGESPEALPGQVHLGAGDIVLQRYSADGTLLWTRQFGTTADDYVRAIAVRGDAIYLAGSTYGTFQGQASAGGLDSWVRRYQPDGDVVWTAQYGTSAWDNADGVEAHSSGVWVTGSTEGVLAGASSSGENDVYVRSYGPAGGLRLTRQFGTAGYDGGLGLAARRKRIHVVGYVSGTLPGQTSKGETDGFLRTYRPDGTIVRTRQFGTAEADSPRDVVVGLGGVYVGGDTLGAFGSASKGGWDFFVRKFDGAGNALWTRQYGSPVDDGMDGVAIADGEVHIGGSTSGALPGETLRGIGDSFVQSYTRAGARAGTRQWGTSGDDEAYGLDGSSSGLYVVGGTDGAFPGETNAGAWDSFVRRFAEP